jgi:DnaD/phage-associated family protein
MAKYRIIQTDFWRNPIVSEEMTPEDKYFYLYLLTNPLTTQIGIYKITKKQIAFDLGYSIESVYLLMERFIEHHKLIRYNPETRELAIKNWGKYNLHKGGKPVMDCISSELKEVEDLSLIEYVAEAINKQEILSLYNSFCKQEETFLIEEVRVADDMDTYVEVECDEFDSTSLSQNTIRGQKEKEKEKQKEKQQQQQKAFHPNVEEKPEIENRLQTNHKTEDVKEIVEFWDFNGFGSTNAKGKEQLLSWLKGSNFLQPKDMIVKAMMIACANDKRKLNYVLGILRNWKNSSLLTVEEVESYEEHQKSLLKPRQSNAPYKVGRDIPREFVLDITAGER